MGKGEGYAERASNKGLLSHTAMPICHFCINVYNYRYCGRLGTREAFIGPAAVDLRHDNKGST